MAIQRKQRLFLTRTLLCWSLAVSASSVALAQDAVEEENSSAKYQLTYNWQKHSAFSSPYAGPNSLLSRSERMYTFSATAHWGKRVWNGGEIYFNPEVVQGIPFSGNLVGLGGFTNGEITRAGGPHPKAYRQRLFLRQTWNQGGGREHIDPDFNQMAGWVDKNRTVLTIGNFSTLDVFDDNAYAKDPRTQFMNWSHWTYAAYDYAADARGYGWGAAIEWIRGAWALRVGRMSAPAEPNGLPLDLKLLKHYGDQLEVEHAHEWLGQPGKTRVLLWRNRARLANFTDALAWLQAHPGSYSTPVALTSVRQAERIKYGLGLNWEQQIREDVGHFLRIMKADGKSETHAFTEVDSSLSTGLLIKGQRWGRANDAVGLAYARNMISRERREFLAAGGTSFFIGDGALRYKPESILEAFYSVGLTKGSWVTLDWQRIQNPAYNADRGPVHVYAARLHLEF